MNIQLEREEEQLEQELAEGHISLAEYNKEMLELHRCYRESAQDAAWDAYDKELGSW